MPLSTDPAINKTAGDLVAQLHTIFGKHDGYRATHARGILLSGAFTPSAAAKTLSKAKHFSDASTPVTVRFSNSTGLPEIPAIDPSARPHGIGIRFHLDGIPLGHSHTDIIAHSTRYFPTRTGAEFLELLRALAAPPPKDGEPSAPEKFLGTHPAAARFVGEDRKAPAGFATDTYWSVNAFKLVNEEGKERHVRYEVHPVTASHLSAEALKGKSPHYLFDELPQQLPADLSLVAQLAAEGDVVDDATSLWPEEREKMELGRFKVEKLVEDGDKAQKKIIFDPLPRVEGVEASADPLLEMRASVYLQSGKERR